MIIAAFDIGYRNFSFCVEHNSDRDRECNDERDDNNDCRENENDRIFLRGDILEMVNTALIPPKTKIFNIKEVLQAVSVLIDEYWDSLFSKCTVFLIEQQQRVNAKALFISHHLMSVLYIKSEYRVPVINFSATYKTRMLGAPKGMLQKERKAWNVRLAMYILDLRKDITYTAKLANSNKKDDMADCLCMIQAYKKLLITHPVSITTAYTDQTRRPQTKKKLKKKL